jgi:hypothetical protein
MRGDRFFAALIAGSLVVGCGAGGLESPDPFQRIEVFVEGAGTGDGRVNDSDPAVSIDCQITDGAENNSTVCDDSFPDAGAGGVFSLTATNDAGSFFAGWVGCSSSAGPVCTLSFTTNSGDTTFNVTAHFYEGEPGT